VTAVIEASGLGSVGVRLYSCRMPDPRFARLVRAAM
jgi:hypothetical protein